MTQPLSHNFISALEDRRDELYAAALAKTGSPFEAEQLLQRTARDLFDQFARGTIADAPRAMARALAPDPQNGRPVAGTPPVPAANGSAGAVNIAATTSATGGGREANGTDSGAAMPADVWARLAAAVQVEAAGSTDARALPADSVLLRPDPLLAPRKAAPRRDTEEFDLSSPSRLLVLAGLALLIGIVVTVWISTRPHVPAPVALSAPRLPGSTSPSTTETTAPSASPAPSTSASQAGAP